ncbi:MAG TPA: dephospho-CoA kinase, partial [Dokdonella sp.]|nr:dephospho-CoA kinase [Dokdonella sp.]
EVQLARLLARDGVSPATAEAMLAAQATRERRLAIADDVIANDGTLADLDRAVGALHERYRAMASAATRGTAP